MWWRFLTFCVLVSFVLFVVLSCIHGRPVIHLFFHRCCEDDIENDQVIFENFGNNFLRERLVGADIVVDDNDSFASEIEAQAVIDAMREKLNVHDPRSRVELELFPVNENDSSELIKTKAKVNRVVNEFSEETTGNVTAASVSENSTFNDSLSDETIDGRKTTSDNDILRELDSEENVSIEATTENVKLKTMLPIRLIDKSENVSKVNQSDTKGVLTSIQIIAIRKLNSD